MEKSQPSCSRPTAAMQRREPWRVSRFLRNTILATCLCLAIYCFSHQSHLLTRPSAIMKDRTQSPISNVGDNAGQDPNPSSKKVPLEAHIMSKCPDAKNCFLDLIVPAMVKVHDKVDFKLSFIGNVSESSSDVSCKHGPSECVGNMLMLCAANLPFPCDPKQSKPGDKCKVPTIRSLGFANCLLRDYKNIPDRNIVEDCALEHGIDFKALNKCASSQSDDPSSSNGELSGLALLRESFRRSQQVGATKSCTVRVDEKEWCILDGGQWKNCQKKGADTVDGIVYEVERLYKERN
ncbi:hypothetical protein D8B26_005140 [Coccidioides posadasii str. Silveira]|uniref:Uncharacterized protein n=4 Tax=Coccidioides TaxID=5500 RepID=E9D5Z7_COCPS|nr:hypothetical protein CPC735_058990 [Coccidioides posadasii C735 delta SOWgp]EFW18341.1 conserved hypothetical protein [Coccidioides posadasii str. Silveira]KMM66277.1 hypothetical protein CPAG_02616 [Coccidioides posadasii RMSCC 3488]KMU81783.1 hypothetical protein CISG_02800 [Coccidioides immitis RMSCC 3703]EER24529.1 hypothetical protein CPC735_058990 [Coccidioides posadasii C735 delta SOWgp]QVM10481.1 hypothetical protein D8B26_005140 [Coccidioides posadasii str. Silveira]|eukprot:XP_003066674.1 hypothetical protein CPC735_058990 [Coccidioides posadasii C735 delta SOWgp]